MEVGDKVKVVKAGGYRFEAGPGAEGVVVEIREPNPASHYDPIDVKLTKFNPSWKKTIGQVPGDYTVFDYDHKHLEVITEGEEAISDE
jgi:hypothetical protein